MARKNGDVHNIGCGAMIAIDIICTVLTCIIIQPEDEGIFLTICLGLGIGYIVSSYINSSDRFKDL